jgi:hypothetical protein
VSCCPSSHSCQGEYLGTARLIQFSFIEQVETLLKTQDPAVTPAEVPPTTFTAGQGGASGINLGSVPAGDFNISNPAIGIVENTDRWRFNGESPQPPLNDLGFGADMSMGMGLDDNTFTWEMIGLGLEEPLPPQETIDELYVMITFYPLEQKLILHFQTPNLLRQDPSINANDSQVPVPRSHEFVSTETFSFCSLLKLIWNLFLAIVPELFTCLSCSAMFTS